MFPNGNVGLENSKFYEDVPARGHLIGRAATGSCRKSTLPQGITHQSPGRTSDSGLGETKFYLGTLLDARLKPTSDCKSTTTQILFTIGEGQIKYQTPSVTLFRQEHPNRCLCLGVR